METGSVATLNSNSRSTVHNVKAAWELAEMGFAIGERAFIDAAVVEDAVL